MAARDQYYITDTSGKFYRLGSKGALVIARDTNEAQIFSFEEAKKKIGKGKKAHFYKTVPVDSVPASEDQEQANTSLQAQLIRYSEILQTLQESTG